MAFSKEKITQIEDLLKSSIINKFENYNPETSYMPFHTGLLGKDRMALYSFIQSLNTNFGTSIFEPVAKVLAESNFKDVQLQVKAGNQISEDAQIIIDDIIESLRTATAKPNKIDEIEAIRKVCRQGRMKQIKPTKVDLYLVGNNDEIYLCDIKTAKPNKGGFQEFKRTLLEWVAVTFAQNPNAKINTFIAIPYNPYFPQPYSRWTMAGMLDLPQELKVAEEFWDFLGGKDSYEQLLGCFERVGVELRPQIDEYFKKFNK